VSLLVAERDCPPRRFVEAVERLDKMAEKSIPSLLAVGDHVETGGFLQGHGLVDGAVLHAFEFSRREVAVLDPLARVEEIRRT
jgi:hypothetical protein